MLIELPRIDPRVLVVEQRGDRLTRGFTLHNQIVDRDGASVPDEMYAGGTGRLRWWSGRADAPGSRRSASRSRVGRGVHPGESRTGVAPLRGARRHADRRRSHAGDVHQGGGRLRRFRGDASARTWILSIARHTCMDELRARSRRQRRSAAMRRRPTDGPAAGSRRGDRRTRPARAPRGRSARRVHAHAIARAELRRGRRDVRVPDRNDPFASGTGPVRPHRDARRRHPKPRGTADGPAARARPTIANREPHDPSRAATCYASGACQCSWPGRTSVSDSCQTGLSPAVSTLKP